MNTFKKKVLANLCVSLLYFSPSLFSQILLSDTGKTYNNTDAVTFDSYGPVNINSCSSIKFSINYSSSLPWPGSGNMESNNECGACTGDPLNLSTDCNGCWDFFYVEFLIDGNVVSSELVGSGNNVQNATFDFTYCANGSNNASINVYTLTWAADEFITFSDITISCQTENITTNITDETCSQGNGKICVSPLGGQYPYQYNWSNGETDSCISNVSSGNYQVTITDVHGCNSTDSYSINNQYIPIELNETIVAQDCGDSTGQICLNPTGGQAPYQYNWSNNVTSVCNTNIPAGIYSVTVTDANGCQDTTQVNMNVLPVPQITFNKTIQVTCDSALILFTNNSSNASSFEWTINDTITFISKNLEYLFPFESSYILVLEATNDLGCKNKITISDSIADFFQYYELIIPNVFTPNNDNMNEKFTIDQHELLKNCTELKVYNRWGKLVFESNNLNTAWDGKNKNGQEMEDGIYYYHVLFKNKDFSGTVHLIR